MSDNEDAQKPTDGGGEDQKPGGEPITIRVRDQVRWAASHKMLLFDTYLQMFTSSVFFFQLHIVVIDWGGNIL